MGGVLADDMGLGKTVQTLAHLMIEKAAGRLDRPSLIVCPTSLIPNWTAEAQSFRAGTVSASRCTAAPERPASPAIPKHDLVLSTYPLLTRDARYLARAGLARRHPGRSAVDQKPQRRNDPPGVAPES